MLNYFHACFRRFSPVIIMSSLWLVSFWYLYLLWPLICTHASDPRSIKFVSFPTLRPSLLQSLLFSWSFKVIFLFVNSRGSWKSVFMAQIKHGISIIVTRWSANFESGQAPFLRETASEMLVFILKVSRLKKFKLVGCKMKTKLHLFNRDVQEMDTTCKNYWKFELKCEWFFIHFVWEFRNGLFPFLNFLFLVQLL